MERIRVGTLMIRDGTSIPESVPTDVEPFCPGWAMLKEPQASGLDRDIRKAGWSLFFLAARLQAMAWGRGEFNTQTALERVLAKARPSNFNCLEVTGLAARRFLGLPYVHITAHSRHIQEGSLLQSLPA